MNPLLLPQIAALLGGQQGLASLPNTPPSPVDPGQPDIQVNNTSLPDPTRRLGLVHGGTFQIGHTGGNILGLIGDALRGQAGLDPMYAPRVQTARDAEALQNFSTDPLAALQKLTMTNPGAALPAFNQYYDNQRADKATNTAVRDKDAEYEDKANDAVGAMLYGANEKTFPQVLARAKAFAARRGIDVSELPGTWDDAKSWALGRVPVDKQEGIEGLNAYRDASVDARNAATAARDKYYNGRLSQYNDVNGERRRHNLAAESNTAAGVGVRRDAVNKAPDRSSWTQPTRGGAVAPGAAKKPVWDPALNKYVLK